MQDFFEFDVSGIPELLTYNFTLSFSPVQFQ